MRRDLRGGGGGGRARAFLIRATDKGSKRVMLPNSTTVVLAQSLERLNHTFREIHATPRGVRRSID